MVDVNRNNNDSAVRRAELQGQLDSLPPGEASAQKRQELLQALNGLNTDLESMRTTDESSQPLGNKKQNNSTGNAILDNAMAILNSLLGLFSGSANPHQRILNAQTGLDSASQVTQEALSAPETEPKRAGVILKGSTLKAMFTTQLNENKERLVADMKREDIGAKAAKPAT